jgi:hypothetical protein
VITALGSFAALAATVLYVATAGGRLASVGGALGLAGLVVLATGLVLRWPVAIPWAVALVGAGYLVSRSGSSLVDGWAAVLGVVLLVGAELATWSVEHDARIRSEPALLVRRAVTLAVLAVSALAVNVLLLGAAGVASSAGVLLAAVGVAAAVSAVAIVLRLVRA